MSTRSVNVPIRFPRMSGQNAIPLHQRMMVGSLAGMLGMVTIFPIDLVKTKLQASSTAQLRGTVRELVRAGFGSFYKGMLPALIGTGPEKAVKLAANDVARALLAPNGGITAGQQVIAGGVAGVFQALVSTPNEMVKLRMQLMDQEVAQGKPRMSTIQVIRDIGPRGMFKGLSATLARDLPYNIVFFPVYATAKSLLCPDGVETTGRLVVCGATAGCVAAWLGTPMDVVKTRLQKQYSPYTGIIDCMRRTYHEEGFLAFFRGSLNRVAVQAPMYAIIMAAFDLQKAYLARSAEA